VPSITYVTTDGNRREVNGSVGTSVMQTAVARGIDGIIGECGGNLMCATCHVYVDPAWLESLEPVDDEENEMLEEVESPREVNSRLSCQIRVSDQIDGLVVTLPERQV
jgi:2Fe-2S ferredoxin